MVDITNILGDGWQKSTANFDPPEVQLADAMRQAGIEPPPNISLDGQLHRFGTKGRKKDDSGWYIAFDDGIPAGRFGCWRDGIEVSWRSEVGRELTASEQMAISKRTSEARAARDAERKKKNEIAASTVDKIWTDAGAASPEHPYLKRKGIANHGARITGDGRLIIPMFNADSSLSSLQYITADGDKKYHTGGAVKSCYWMIGTEEQTIFIAEGFATAATILEVTNQSVAIAYSAGNIPSVAQQMRERFGATQKIVIVADNDKSGVGKNYAEQAAAKMGARIVIPPEEGDANDYRTNGGDLHELLYPATTEYLVRGKSFFAQPAPINWLVKHWIQSDALVMVHGPSGGGKTFVVLDWMLHIAAGIPEWFGHKVKCGRVVYLAGEGHHGLKGRLAAWAQEHKVDDPDIYLSKHGVDLNTPEGYQVVREAILALDLPPSVIVIDTLHRFLRGDENSAQDAKSMLDACAALQLEFSCTVILVHHTGVSEEAQHRARGSSAWKGALDIEISIVPSKNDGPISIVQRKSKDAEEADDVYVDLQSVAINGWIDEDEEQVTSAVIVSADAPIKVKKDGPLENNMGIFEKAWWATAPKDTPANTDVKDNMPYVSREAMKKYIIETMGKAEATAVNWTNKGEPTKGMGLLEARGVISQAYNGWIINDLSWASALMIQRDGK
tara:strand:- start:13879 stop:15894 length:2016 start_codon:yes stop_codon:yes gene_type:complete